ncbi:MAG: transglutaminase-like domain-containing protein [Clostridiaceae bacterium]
MEEFKEDIIYILLVFINFLFAFNLMKFSYAVLDFDYRISFSYVLIAVLIFLLLKYGIKKTWIKVTLLSIMLISSACYIFINRAWIMSRVIYDFNIINNNISNDQAISFKNLYIILIIIIPLIIIALFLYSRGLYISIPVLTLSFVLFLWYTGYTKEVIEYIFKYTFLNVFTFVVISYIKNKKTFRKKDVKVKTSIFGVLIYGILLAVIFSSIVRIMPKEYNGKLTSDSYSYFRNKYEKKTAKNPTVSEKYNISYSGYNDSNTSLGGPIKPDNSKAFEVYGQNYLYLRGNIKDYYTGSSWLSKINSYRNDNQNIIYSKELIKNSIATVRIKPIGLTTSTVFAPPASIKVDNEGKQVFADSYGCFLREKPYNTEYTVSFYDGIKLIDDYKGLKTNGISTNKMPENYLQVPDTVPEEVFRLVRDIIEKNKAVSDYDKVVCLKKYLEQNYKYTLNTKELPEGADFVDNFLFKEKQGYCTYFASALAIMCRIADVPAIYVEGYKQTGSSIVTNNMAHAWVEVNLTNDDMWLIADPSPSAYQNSIVDVNKPKTETGANVTKKNNTKNENTSKSSQQGKSEKTWSISKNTFIILLIVSSFLLIVLSKILFMLIRKRKLINSKSIIPLMFYSLKRLRRLGIKKGETEGFLEYAERIRDKELGDNMIILSKSYCSEAFGNKKIEIDKKQIYKFMECKIRKEKGLIKYYLDKILR